MKNIRKRKNKFLSYFEQMTEMSQPKEKPSFETVIALSPLGFQYYRSLYSTSVSVVVNLNVFI